MSLPLRPTAGRPLVGLCLALLVLLGGGREAAAAQGDPEALEEGRELVTELFQARTRRMLAELAEHVELPDAQLAAATARLEEVCTEFRAAQPGEFEVQRTRVNNLPPPLRYRPFSELMESRAWGEALEETLPAEAREVLVARHAARRAATVDALTAVVRAKTVHSLCLTEAEVERLEPALRRAAEALIGEGLEELYMDSMNFGGRGEDPFLARLESSGVEDVLGTERWAIVEDMIGSGRRTLEHDLGLEAEYLLEGREDAEALRPLLLGAAEALTHREGRSPTSKSRLDQPTGGRRDFEWDAVLRGVLDLPGDQDLGALPLRTDSDLSGPRARYVLAVLDERACLTEAQRASLLPLLEELMAALPRSTNDQRRGRDVDLLVPSELELPGDGRYMPGPNPFRRASTKSKALVETLFETCTPEQREALGK